ncbi:ESF1 homolog isoform X2 [Frieseomelitta varia]|uniref:ESF1 homolog isoform X2 n=1 Tax=Frieseomelitta varia TaxID=561572 RepID=UPI001CB6A7C4|nr:ESF1 homolog isoform X2 [Frieseomelitta varia]
MDELLNDKRFAYVARDPKFKRIPKAERKVKIDKRFQSMFKDKKFTVQYTIDKRGRPVNQTSSENLKKYYDLSSSEEENDEEEHEKPKQKEKKFRKDKKEGTTKNKIPRSKESSRKNSTSEDATNSPLLDKQLLSYKSSNSLLSNEESISSIKPKEESDVNSEEQSDTESESDIDDITSARSLKLDLKESERQLNIRSKHESGKLTDDIKAKLRNLSVNYARGEGLLMTDSSSDEESSEDSDEDIEHNWGELDKEAESTEEITHRLAVCNMDWDRIRAVDLMVLFNSFLPTGGFIHSVTIYPSEFGLQRMKEEEIKGPKELTDINKEIENENDNEEGSAYHMEKLRQYQLNRLKYYYAVVDVDSAETANKIYSDCDGTEYESTATRLDLRFIPDDMEFHQTPKEVCSKLPDPTKYQPRQFTTTALQQVKVQLTWDETNPERMEIAQKLNSGKLNEITDNDLQAYLATESSDDESGKEEGKKSQKNKSDSEAEETVEPIEKYKALLKEIEEKEESKQKKDVELEFTWGLGTKEKAEKLVQERLKKDQKLTPFEQYLEKRKEKKKAKREERMKRKNADRDVLDSEDSEMLPSDNEIENNKLSYRGENTVENDSFTSSDSESEEKRKAELELLLMDENDDGKQHFNMKKIEENATMTKSKQKRLSKKKNGQNQIIKDNFEVNVRDSRFNALYTSHHFNIDPADPHYRKTKGSEALIKEKLKRRIDSEHSEVIPAKEIKLNSNTELQSLIKSVKKNAKNISRPIK